MPNPPEPAGQAGRVAAMLEEVRAGLTGPGQKWLPPKFFYDERGSALFDEITRLPEYYLTNAERALLRTRGPALVARLRPRTLIELGAGSADKTRVLLDAMVESGGGELYCPVDISGEALAGTAAGLREEYPGLRVEPVVGDVASPEFSLRSDFPRPALLAFLGSTIGNFAGQAAVRPLRAAGAVMRDSDRFLLGIDLRKDRATLEAAYNDAAGVTAEFNLNVLRVLNRELHADFDPSAFRHRAFYNADESRIEMHLVAERAQDVSIPGVGAVRLDAGESIRTELSCKYDRAAVEELLAAGGLALEEWWTGEEALFALAVARRSGP